VSDTETHNREHGFLRDVMRRISTEVRDDEAGDRQQALQYEAQIAELQERIRVLEAEARVLRRRALGGSNGESVGQPGGRAATRNEELTAALQKARAEIQTLREEVEKLSSPPLSYGVFLKANEDKTSDVLAAGRKLRVNAHPKVDLEQLSRGQEVVLNDAMNIVQPGEYERQGEIVRIKEILGDNRLVVNVRADEEKVVEMAAPLSNEGLKAGDLVRLDSRTGHVYERLDNPDMHDLLLEEVPDVTYDHIGGLTTQVEQIEDAIELPYLHPEEFRAHKLDPPKGVLLYGPPGCGKTLMAKAMANSLAKRLEKQTGAKTKGYFINIKGPELLDKYVGETERKIRDVFKRAKEKAAEGMPVVIFFDEMDSLLRTRGSGISSDVENSIVPQFLAEIDGVEGLRNVIVVGASNRQDLIDPAVLRPGRMNIKIKIDRPDREGSKDIFTKYLTPDLPIETKPDEDVVQAIHRMIGAAVEEMFATSDDKKFLEVTYANGEKETLYFKDFVSGAMIENIVSRAKKSALKRAINGGTRGISEEDVLAAVRAEFSENEDLPNTTNPDDWVKISGRRSERIVNVRTINKRAEAPRRIETVTPGHYL